MGMLGLTEVRMPQPSLSPREHVGRSSGGREAAPSGQGFVLTAWKGRSVGSGSFSALPAGRQTQPQLGNSLYCL